MFLVAAASAYINETLVTAQKAVEDDNEHSGIEIDYAELGAQRGF